jgi:23S rRNA (uridine2552-2'-O)-methyltransferase
MAPKTTGVKLRDQTRSVELALAALHMGAEVLAPGGAAVIKVFQGPDVPDLLVQMRSVFSKTKTFKPKSSRAESTEIFVLGLERKEGAVDT